MTTPADPPASYDDVSTRTILVIVSVGAILVFVAILAVQVLYLRYDRLEITRKVIDTPTLKSNEILARQREMLASTGPGTDEGSTRTPINQAMMSVLDRYQSEQKNSTPDKDKAAAKNSAAAKDNAAAKDRATANENKPQVGSSEKESRPAPAKKPAAADSEELPESPVTAPKPETADAMN